MLLSQLLSTIASKNRPNIPILEINGIAFDSRKVGPNFVFVALRGLNADGHSFIDTAIQNGAVAIVCEELPKNHNLDAQTKQPVFVEVSNSRKTLSALAAHFFGYPSTKMRTVGITGTNGKTTLSYLIEAIFDAANISSAVLGTIEYRYPKHRLEASHTTPESLPLQEFLAEAFEAGTEAAILEVSSHALALNRVEDIDFDAAIFTNLSPEHLDYHANLDEYFETKARLFLDLLENSKKQSKAAILNLDDPRICEFTKRLESSQKNFRLITFSLTKDQNASVYPVDFDLSLDGISAEVQTPAGSFSFSSPLLGAFNLSNLLAAIAAASFFKIPIQKIREAIASFYGAPGRLERVVSQKGPRVFVDYAHTPDALKNVLETLRQLTEKSQKPSKIITVFGCGGDRDRKKRPLMGFEVARFSDLAVVTSDNPRSEDPQKIIDEILPGIYSSKEKPRFEFEIEPDRKRAIELAIKKADLEDIVLIAGKGHEDYQIIKEQKFHFDDREVALNALGLLHHLAKGESSRQSE